MAKKIQQVRYYPGSPTDKNYPSNVTKATLKSGNAFVNYLPIVQLGIQTLPGVKFHLNGANNEIIVGSTGIYEIDVTESAQITGLSFDENSLSMIDASGSGYLIVDILYEKED